MGGFAPGGTVLESSKEEKDIGVIISDSLKPSSQCAVAARKANQVLGQMSRSFHYRDRFTWIKLYKVYVRPHLEYAVQAWSPWTQEDINLLENVQRRAIRMTSGLAGHTYEERLIEVGLTSLEARRLRGDLIQTWKILHGYDNVDESCWFSTCETANRLIRQDNSSFNLNVKQFNSNVRKNSFSVRVINPWNSLPD